MSSPVFPWRFPDPAFPFAILDVPGHLSYPTHRHRCTEIVYIVRGHGVHMLDGVASSIAAGDCFVIPVERAHAYAEVTDLHLINILFDARLLAPFHPILHALPGFHALLTLEPTYRKQHDARGRLRPTAAQRVAIAALIRQLLEESRLRAAGYRGKLLALFVQLLIDLARYYQERPGRPSAQLLQIGAVISKIEQDYAHPLHMRELAAIACMSERNLTRRFREGVGLAPIEYLLRLRIRHAAALLRETGQSIAGIAAAVGMADSNYFSRQFSRMMGVSPRVFRASKAVEGQEHMLKYDTPDYIAPREEARGQGTP